MDDHLVILTLLITVLQVLGEKGEKVQVEENNGDDVTPVLTEEKWVGVKGQRVKGGGVKDSRGTYFFSHRSHTSPDADNPGSYSLGSGIRSQFAWWQLLLLTVLTVSCLFLLVKCVIELRAKNWDVTHLTCHLCLSKVKRLDWDEHRESCKNDSSHLLLKLPPHPGIKCPRCTGPLRRWPELRGEEFSCDQGDVLVCRSRGTNIRNTGGNRYTCFPCDIDICSDCAGKEAKLLDRQRRRSMTSNESRDPRHCKSASSSQLPADVHRRLSAAITMEPGRRRHSCVPAANRSYRRSSTRFEIDIDNVAPKDPYRKWSSPMVNGHRDKELAEESEAEVFAEPLIEVTSRRDSRGEALVATNGRRRSSTREQLEKGRRLSSVVIEEVTGNEGSHSQRRGSTSVMLL